MVYQCTRSISTGSFDKGNLLEIKLTFQTGSPPNENGAELLSMMRDILIHLTASYNYYRYRVNVSLFSSNSNLPTWPSLTLSECFRNQKFNELGITNQFGE